MHWASNQRATYRIPLAPTAAPLRWNGALRLPAQQLPTQGQRAMHQCLALDASTPGRRCALLIGDLAARAGSPWLLPRQRHQNLRALWRQSFVWRT